MVVEFIDGKNYVAGATALVVPYASIRVVKNGRQIGVPIHRVDTTTTQKELLSPYRFDDTGQTRAVLAFDPVGDVSFMSSEGMLYPVVTGRECIFDREYHNVEAVYSTKAQRVTIGPMDPVDGTVEFQAIWPKDRNEIISITLDGSSYDGGYAPNDAPCILPTIIRIDIVRYLAVPVERVAGQTISISTPDGPSTVTADDFGAVFIHATANGQYKLMTNGIKNRSYIILTVEVEE
jgi:hypothetical protein